jgi:hypothetical protein
MEKNAWNTSITTFKTRLRWIDVDFKRGNGFSMERMNNAMSALMIGMIGNLTMSVMKMAAPGAGLSDGDQRVTTCEVAATYCKPPGSLKVPPTKSQKNLR